MNIPSSTSLVRFAVVLIALSSFMRGSAQTAAGKPVVNPLQLPSEIMVSQPVNFNNGASNNPTKFTITGLASGLSYDPLTGTITGRATVPGAFPCRLVCARDAAREQRASARA